MRNNDNALSSSLSMFVSQNDNSGFNNPFDDDIQDNDIPEIRVRKVLERDSELRTEQKKDKKKDKFTRVLERGNALVEDLSDEELVCDFDNYISSFLSDDEDADLKNNLISLGRKYARDTQTSAESSEVTKAFMGTEKVLDTFLGEIKKDKNDIQKDIDSMRVSRTRNMKTLAELISAKGQYHNMALSIIKEKNSMIKTQFDLKNKADKQNKDDTNSEVAASRAVQQLFGMGRGNLMSGVGGYSEVSGALNDSDVTSESFGINEDAVIHQKYFAADDENFETDGDKFLKYEGAGIEYVLLWDKENNTTDVIAEDPDGNVIPDYPMPSNIDTLHFDISESTGTASDELHRAYKLRSV